MNVILSKISSQLELLQSPLAVACSHQTFFKDYQLPKNDMKLIINDTVLYPSLVLFRTSSSNLNYHSFIIFVLQPDCLLFHSVLSTPLVSCWCLSCARFNLEFLSLPRSTAYSFLPSYWLFISLLNHLECVLAETYPHCVKIIPQQPFIFLSLLRVPMSCHSFVLKHIWD